MSDIWIDTRGEGDDVLLIAGLGDPAEAWEAQLDGLSGSWRVTAFDNRGVGRTPLPEDGALSIEMMAGDAAAVLDKIGAANAHVCGFSGGSAIAQELALRHPDRVRSLVLVSTWSRADAQMRAMGSAWRRMVENATDERAMLEDFLVWIYTARAHESGLVEQIIDETLAFPYPLSGEAFLTQLDAFVAHDTYDRLHAIDVPALVIAGAEDIATPPRLGKVVAEQIPGALFELLEGEAHQPFQESPREFNARVEAFWRSAQLSERSWRSSRRARVSSRV